MLRTLSTIESSFDMPWLPPVCHRTLLSENSQQRPAQVGDVPLRCSEIQGMPLVAHNASFDIGVLRHTLDDYKIPHPELDYYCTRAISQALWTALPSYGLELVSHYLGLPFTHHAVEDDAIACATIVL